MFTQTCTLAFADGSTVTARVTVASPQSRGVVQYSGAISHLPSDAPQTAVPATLRLVFADIARELLASYSDTSEGTFDRWAE